MAAPVADQAWLAWIGRLVEGSTASGEKRSSSEFHCWLDDQPDHLVPAPYARPESWEGLTDRPLHLNPRGRFAECGEHPCPVDQLQGQARPFSDGQNIFCIQDSGHGGWSPFWLSPALRSFLENLPAGGAGADSLAALTLRLLKTLVHADVLVTEDRADRRSAAWSETITQAEKQFCARGFAPVRGLIHPFHISALRRYYRWQVRHGRLHLGDGQSPLRYAAHNDSAARFFHHQLTAAVSALAGEPLKPTYSYVASYQPGARLERHTDREQCEVSLSLCLDYSPEPDLATPWPLLLHADSRSVTVFQALGDALLYRGRQIPHSRGRLPDGHTSTSVFFHYVPVSFQGTMD